MSDNSAIVVSWHKDHYNIEYGDIECMGSPYSICERKTLRGAIVKAKDIQDYASPEYGIIIGRIGKKDGPEE